MSNVSQIPLLNILVDKKAKSWESRRICQNEILCFVSDYDKNILIYFTQEWLSWGSVLTKMSMDNFIKCDVWTEVFKIKCDQN